MKKEARLDLKTIIPIIVLICVLAYGIFAATTVSLSKMTGNVSVTIGGNTVKNHSARINFTVTMEEIDAASTNVSNVSIYFDARYLNFTDSIHANATSGVSVSSFNVSLKESPSSGNVTIFWNISAPGKPFNGTFTFNVTPVLGVEIRDTFVWVKIFNLSGDTLLYNAKVLTFDVDSKAPSVSYLTVNHTNSSTNVSVLLNFSVTDINVDMCKLYIGNYSAGQSGPGDWLTVDNGSGRTLNGSETNGGFRYNFSGGDGTYVWNVWCNDTVGLSAFNVTNYTINIDTIPPDYGLFNVTRNLINETNNATNTESDASSTVAQGDTIYAFFNFSDATTGLYSAILQVYNTTKGTWMDFSLWTGNYSNTGVVYNTTYTFCNVADCYQSGRNVTIRVNASDYVGNTNVTRNLTVQVNDTVKPRIDTISISGGGNGTNVSTTTIYLNWTMSELNNISWLSWVIDGKSTTSGWYGNYTVTAGSAATVQLTPSEMGSLKNGFVVRSGGYDAGNLPTVSGAKLANGTHEVFVRVMDSWGNMRSNNYSFTVDTSVPHEINMTFSKNRGDINTSGLRVSQNISLYGYARVNVSYVGVAGLKKIQFNTSCNSTWKTISNNSLFQPFNNTIADNNLSGCTDLDSIKYVMLNVTDFADSSTIITFTVGLDNVSPDITLDYIDGIAVASVEGYEFSRLNITINYTTPEEYTYLSSVGYYLDDNPYVELNGVSAPIDQTKQYRNMTNVTLGGKHTLILQANDSVGNARNTSMYTFYTIGLVDIPSMRVELESYLNNTHVINVNITNGSTDISAYQVMNSSNPLAIRISLDLNRTSVTPLNVTLEIINSSAIMWEHINFSVTGYDSADLKTINDNYSASVVRMVRFNDSAAYGASGLDDFISDTNAYYGTVIVPYNFTKLTNYVPMWFSNESDYTDRTVIGACSASNPGGNVPYTAARANPCYNLTANGKTTLFVPYFSTVAVVNDSNASFIVINEPKAGTNSQYSQNTSTFYINLSVSGDASYCDFKINATGYYNGDAKNFGTTWTAMATPTGTVPKNCISLYPVSLANRTSRVYNLTLNVTDAVGNKNTTIGFIFNVTDIHVPALDNVTNRSITSSGATIGVESNEYVNASVTYLTGTVGRQSSSLFTTKKPTVSLSLSASTFYNYSVTVCDYAGNCNSSGEFNFTTSAAAATPSAPAAAAAGGGGGGVTVAAVSNVAAKQSQVWNKISAGESVTMAVSNENIALTQIVTDVKNDVMSASIEASSLKDKPSETSSASSKVYQYLEIKPANLADADVSGAKISFEVTTAWLTTNNVANDDIALLRYEDDKWNILPTTLVGTTPYTVKYEATTEGFSFYAIGTKSGVGIEPEEAAPEEAAPEEVAPPAEEKKPIVTPPPAASYLWLIVLIFVIIVVLIYLWTKKKK